MELNQIEKAFYNRHYGIPLETIENPLVEEYLFWRNKGIDPRGLYPWSGNGTVGTALALHFDDEESIFVVIEYITDNT